MERITMLVANRILAALINSIFTRKNSPRLKYSGTYLLSAFTNPKDATNEKTAIMEYKRL